MKASRHNGRSGKHGVYDVKHNDRDFDVEHSEHIDSERTKQNVYWDCYQGYSFAGSSQERQFNFTEIERAYYYEHYSDFVDAQNERNEQARHPERNRTIDDVLKNNKTCPEESVIQLGNIDHAVTPDVIKVVANENRYHPVLDRINSITWDGWERIRYALHHFLGAEVSEYTYEVMKLFMIGTIARISCPGIKFEVMLCLVGGQGAGKSTFLRFLAMEDDWFTDDLKKMDDDNVYRKIQGHLIIEFPEMVAILNAKNVEDTKSFMSRQKDTYKTPYDRHPKDHKRQCVFAGSSNSLDFLPMDRSGNRRFLPILCNMEEAETHILDDEKTSREYIDQMWAEAMEIYRSGKCQLRLPKEMEKELCEYQKQFMQEDTKKELILDYLEHYEGSMVCSRQLYSEALGNDGNPAQWEIREINDIMNNCSNWIAFSNPRHFPEPYRRQKGWEKPDNRGQDFQPITKEQMEQLSLPPEWMER